MLIYSVFQPCVCRFIRLSNFWCIWKISLLHNTTLLTLKLRSLLFQRILFQMWHVCGAWAEKMKNKENNRIVENWANYLFAPTFTVLLHTCDKYICGLGKWGLWNKILLKITWSKWYTKASMTPKMQEKIIW